MLDEMPKFAAIDAPVVGNVAGRKIHVVLENHANPPLYVELTTPNFEYLQKVVARQIEDGSTKRLAARSSDKGGLCTGVSRINTGRYQGALRVVKKAPDDEDKSTATTIIKAESSQRANELAKDFIENGGSNKRRRSRGADQDEENEVEDVRDNVEPAVAEHDANSPAVEEEEDE